MVTTFNKRATLLIALSSHRNEFLFTTQVLHQSILMILFIVGYHPRMCYLYMPIQFCSLFYSADVWSCD